MPSARPRALLLDPVAFRGGSKVAAEHALACLPAGTLEVWVLSADPFSWQCPGLRRVALHLPAPLHRASRGVPYALRHLLILLQVLWLYCRAGGFRVLIGNSGPGVDLALYLCRALTGTPLLQWVHGPVAASRLQGRCLARAERVLYLPDCRSSLARALALAYGPYRAAERLGGQHWQPLVNGLPQCRWPSPAAAEASAVFWAASLLRWKGLDLLLEAIERIPPEHRPVCEICYLRPRDSALPQSIAPRPHPGVAWHEAPADLDAIRRRCGVFVSTSDREPFGLSILEALAAGLCVVLPADGAYWDRQLVDGEDCLKYRPGDAEDLARVLGDLQAAPLRRRCIATRGAERASDYRAESIYAPLCRILLDLATAPALRRQPLSELRDLLGRG